MRRIFARFGPFVGVGVTAAVLVLLALHVGGNALSLAGAGVVALGLTVLCDRIAYRLHADEAARRIGAAEEDRDANTTRLADALALRREAETVLASGTAHLMVIDSSYRIVGRYGDRLEDVFHQRDRGNENFLNTLHRLLGERAFQTARDFLALQFDPSKKERTLAKINPLEEIEIGTAGGSEARFISFAFTRIYEEGAVSRVVVRAEDVTERAIREHELRESENRKVKQFEILLGILHVSPAELDAFVSTALRELELAERNLDANNFANVPAGSTAAADAAFSVKLDRVIAHVHNVKGNANLHRLDHFARVAEEIEQRIFDLKHRPMISGDDFLTCIIALADFRADIDDLEALRGKLASVQRNVATSERLGDQIVSSVGDLARSLAQKHGKSVTLEAERFDTRGLPVAQRLAIKDAVVQLTRNSVVHGLETSAERVRSGKSPVGTIEIRSFVPKNGGFGFTFRDDGRGLDAKVIRERGVRAGLVDAARATAIDDVAIAGLIFAPGFTTAEPGDSDAGRGMGMSIVKRRIVDDCRGEIAVDSQRGRYCEFVLRVPAPAAAGAVR